MIVHKALRRKMLLIWAILWVQRTLRLLLRASWMGLAGFVLAWAVNERWGLFPQERQRLVMASFFAVPFLLSALVTRPRLHRLSWRMDRYYALQEQMSGAWQVVLDRDNSRVAQALLAEATVSLNKVRNRILLWGWHVTKDLLSLMLTCFVFWLLFLQPEPPPPMEIPPYNVSEIPQLGSDPTADDIFPAGIPGVTERDQGAGEQEADLYSPSETLERALQGLGEELSDRAISYDAGQAMQRGDLRGAAQGLEALGDQMRDVSSETLQEMADEFERAAQRIQASELPQERRLAETLAEVAESLGAEQAGQAQESLDAAAQVMRDLDDQLLANVGNSDDGSSRFGAGVLADQLVSERIQSELEAFQRLQGVGESFDLGAGEEQSGGLTSASSDDAGGPQVGGAYNLILTGDEADTPQPLVPYHYWRVWRGVVSTYFSPQ